MTEKARQNRLRWALAHQWYRLTKIRRQRNYGQYAIVAEDVTAVPGWPVEKWAGGER